MTLACPRGVMMLEMFVSVKGFEGKFQSGLPYVITLFRVPCFSLTYVISHDLEVRLVDDRNKWGSEARARVE